MTKHELVAPPVGTIYAATTGAPVSMSTNTGRLSAAPKKLCGYADSSPTPKGSRYSAWLAWTFPCVSAESSEMRA